VLHRAMQCHGKDDAEQDTLTSFSKFFELRPYHFMSSNQNQWQTLRTKLKLLLKDIQNPRYK
jgi:hypothetical protein